jgi:hypothetical protein
MRFDMGKVPIERFEADLMGVRPVFAPDGENRFLRARDNGRLGVVHGRRFPVAPGFSRPFAIRL